MGRSAVSEIAHDQEGEPREGGRPRWLPPAPACCAEAETDESARGEHNSFRAVVDERARIAEELVAHRHGGGSDRAPERAHTSHEMDRTPMRVGVPRHP